MVSYRGATAELVYRGSLQGRTWASLTIGVAFTTWGLEGVLHISDCSAVNDKTECDISLILREQEWFIWTNTQSS
jgi:hypothetical protein